MIVTVVAMQLYGQVQVLMQVAGAVVCVVVSAFAGASVSNCVTFFLQLGRYALLPCGHQQGFYQGCIRQLCTRQECHLLGVHP